MKILKKLMILLVLAALIIGCSKEPENNYLGNLKVGYTMKLDDKEVPKAKFEFFYGRALTKYLNQYYSAFSDDYASIVDFNIEKDINEKIKIVRLLVIQTNHGNIILLIRQRKIF